MIFKKGDSWKISGYPQRYSSFQEAQSILEKLQRRAELDAEMKEQAERLENEQYQKEREEKLKKLAENSTPYEIMIAKNVCLICNLEPCECFAFTEEMEPGL